jgi:SAM-dependent methyltransferase
VTDARERWNDRYLGRDREYPTDPAPFLVTMAHHLPETGSALDIGGGLGTNARWLADRGLDVTLLDVSDVALQIARGGPGPPVTTMRRDVEADGLPAGSSWDVVLMHLFYDRHLVLTLPDHVTEGGVLLVCQPTVTNLERHERPSERFLLADGEVEALAEDLVARGDVEILEASAAWRASGRHDAWLVVRRVPSP